MYINLIEKAAVVHSKQIGAQQGCDILPHCNVNNKHDGCRVRANLHLCFTCCLSQGCVLRTEKCCLSQGCVLRTEKELIGKLEMIQYIFLLRFS